VSAAAAAAAATAMQQLLLTFAGCWQRHGVPQVVGSYLGELVSQLQLLMSHRAYLV
jgi:hypothetical protein